MPPDHFDATTDDPAWAPPPVPAAQFQLGIIEDPRLGQVLIIDAGRRPPRRLVPPAGPEHARDVPQWARRIEVKVSPQGRSVRVWIDGGEVRRLLAHPQQTADCPYVHRGHEGTAYCTLGADDGRLVDQARQLVAAVDAATTAPERIEQVESLLTLFRQPQETTP